jgi:thymidylate synthase (FAD)
MIADRIGSERITREQMQEFIEKRLETGHASPLEHVWFEFAIAGVSRAFSHQFVRHHIGISFRAAEPALMSRSRRASFRTPSPTP